MIKLTEAIRTRQNVPFRVHHINPRYIISVSKAEFNSRGFRAVVVVEGATKENVSLKVQESVGAILEAIKKDS